MDLGDVWGPGSALQGEGNQGRWLFSHLGWWEAGAGILVMEMWGPLGWGHVCESRAGPGLA